MIQSTVVFSILEVSLLTAAAGPIEPGERQAMLTASELRCEYAVNPLGLDAARPRFGWVLRSTQRGQMQSAYRVLVASSKETLLAGVGDKWDSGKVDSDTSVNVPYQGKPLVSGEKCWWKIRVWDKGGEASAWSETASFEMGLLKQSDWKGRWIGLGPGRLTFVAGRLAEAVQLDGKIT